MTANNKTASKAATSTEIDELVSKKKYITLNEGIDYRKIAEIMSRQGFKMNHATARNQLMLAMENLLTSVGREFNVKLGKKQVSELLKNQDVHNALADILYLAYNNKRRDGEDV